MIIFMTSALFFLSYFFLLQWLNIPAGNAQTHPNFNLAQFPAFCLTMQVERERQIWKRRERHQKGAWHKGRQSKRNTKHYFWQLLRASPSVTLITFQLWEDGYSIQHGGTQPGSCSTVGHASTLPPSLADAFWPSLFLYLCNCIA